MVEFCPWNEVFGIYKRAENEAFVILYWYLFNKPDYQSNIVKEMKKLEESFKNLPKGILHNRNIGKYLHKMEEYNLIGRLNTDKKPYYFQALSFFYVDPFCIKTPKSKEKDIKSHYKEYREYVDELWITKKKRGHAHIIFGNNHLSTVYLLLSFNHYRNNSVVPAQKIVQDYALEPSKFMRKILRGERDHIALYELIIRSFTEVDYLFNPTPRYIPMEVSKDQIEIPEVIEALKVCNDFFKELENFKYPDFQSFEILDKEKSTKLLEQSKLSLIKRYGIAEWVHELDKPLPDNKIKRREEMYWSWLRDHGKTMKEWVECILRRYGKYEKKDISLNKKTLKFE